MKKSISLDPGRIRYWRTQRGLTQQALGDQVLASGKPASRLRRIQAWERSGRVWDRLAEDLAGALDVALADLEHSNADISGLWLCWCSRSLPPRSAALQSSLHEAFEHIHTQIERLSDRHQRLQATLIDADTLFRIELLAIDAPGAAPIEPLFMRRVRWTARDGLLWRRPTTLERDGLQRLFNETLHRYPGIEPRNLQAMR